MNERVKETITLTDIVKSWRIRISVQLAKLCFCVLTTIVAAYYITLLMTALESKAVNLYQKAMQSITKIEVTKEFVETKAAPLPELIETVARESHVPVVALRAIVEKESSNGEALYKFEEGKYSELKGKLKLSDSEIRMLASSHGPAHVMGFNAKPRCNITWDKLYDSYTGLKCGAKILRENLDKYSNIPDPSRRLWFAARDYNGSGVEAEVYATQFMAKVGSIMFNDLKEEM